jgi:hypothetical protein
MYFASIFARANPGFQQFAVDPRRTQTRVGKSHSSDEIRDFTRNRPVARGCRLFHLQYSRNPFRYKLMMVSGLTIFVGDRRSVHRCDSQSTEGSIRGTVSDLLITPVALKDLG